VFAVEGRFLRMIEGGEIWQLSAGGARPAIRTDAAQRKHVSMPRFIQPSSGDPDRAATSRRARVVRLVRQDLV